MILVALGTQDKSFKRLLEAVEKQIDKGNIREEVVVQAGHTKYESKKMRIFDFIPTEDIKKLKEEARIIIAHAGVGTIIECLDRNKTIIVAPRLKVYGEHTNDHQLQILDKFAREGHIIPLYDFEKLDEALREAETFIPKKYISNNENFVKLVESHLNTLK